MKRILILLPGAVPPRITSDENVHWHLSKYFMGDVIQPCWRTKQSELAQNQATFGPEMNFNYHFVYSSDLAKPLRVLVEFYFFLVEGLKLASDKHVDLIVAYGLGRTAMAAALIKRGRKIPLLVDVPGNPIAQFSFDKPKRNFLNQIKQSISNLTSKWLISYADHLKLLYPAQVDTLATDNKPRTVFHEFVPISKISPGDEEGNYLLFVGHPFYLKGVDLLLNAFLSIAADFPKLALKIVGFEPNLAVFKKLAAGNPRIEFSPPLPNNDIIRLMQSCSAFVLPSRTEAMGRVLLEAMACQKAVIASRVDGIPHYVEDGQTGLLFEPGNAADLAVKLRTILVSDELRQTLGANARQKVIKHYTEESYVKNYEDMVSRCLAND